MNLRVLACSLALWVVSAVPAGAGFVDREGVRAFIDEIAAREGLNAAELRGLFGGIERQEEVLEAIARPAEALPWHRYRPIFVTDERVQRGVEFMHEHAAWLARAESEYGVPPAVVTAVIGVETFYGRRAGRHPVLDTLATLAFDYPPRADFFRRELEQFLLLARDERLDPRAVKGSYAGAMGMPQFVASSYRHYAVDFDGDGRRDLWDSPADAIGSVAAYLERHGWAQDRPVAARVQPADGDYRELVGQGLRPRVSADELRRVGLDAGPAANGDERVAVIELDGADGPEVWLGWRNFYAITRYNQSALYALAVHQIAERIRDGAAQAGPGGGR